MWFAISQLDCCTSSLISCHYDIAHIWPSVKSGLGAAVSLLVMFGPGCAVGRLML